MAPRLSAFRHRAYRLYWFGLLAPTVGAQMLGIAINWQVYAQLKDASSTVTLLGRSFTFDLSALALGSLNLARVLPIFALAIVGGLLADLISRRRLLVTTQSAAGLLALTLAVLTFTGHAGLPALFLLTAAVSAVATLELPARESLVPNLVPRADLLNAVSLNLLLFTFGAIVGPLLAGALAAWATVGVIYVVVALAYLPALWALGRLPNVAPVTLPAGRGWAAVVEGFRFTRRTRLIWSTMILDFFATFLGSARALLPIVADQTLGMGAAGYGLLASAQPVGGLLAGMAVSIRRDLRGQGLIFLVCLGIYGAATALFGLSSVLVIALTLWALTGAADVVSSIVRGTIRQAHTPDELRGRTVGVNAIFFSGGPLLGEVRAGMMAAAFGVTFAIVSGGVAAALLVVWGAWRAPYLRRYDGAEG